MISKKLGEFWDLVLSLFTWCKQNPLPAASIGLMITSGGIDGVYLQKINSWFLGGYALNMVADIVTHTLTVEAGKLTKRKAKWKVWAIAAIVVIEIFAISYTWLFSWRQIRGLMVIVEPVPVAAAFNLDAFWVTLEREVLAFVIAGFCPLLLSGVGLIEGLTYVPEKKSGTEPASERLKPAPKQLEPLSFECPVCDKVYERQIQLTGHMKAHPGWREAKNNGGKVKLETH